MQFVDFLGDGLADFAHRPREKSAADRYVCARMDAKGENGRAGGQHSRARKGRLAGLEAGAGETRTPSLFWRPLAGRTP